MTSDQNLQRSKSEEKLATKNADIKSRSRSVRWELLAVGLVLLAWWFHHFYTNWSTGSLSIQKGEKMSPKEQQTRVVQAFQYAFDAYEKYAFGHDTLKPVSMQPDGEWFGLANTLIDCLDTAHLMGLDDVVRNGRDFIANELRFDKTDGLSNVFEVTIRIVGSLLSMHHLTGDKIYLTKALELAQLFSKGRSNQNNDQVRGIFDTRLGIPMTSFIFSKGTGHPDHVASLAECTTIQLEWRQLSLVTGDFVYWQKVENVHRLLFQPGMDGALDGLLPIYISMESGAFVSREIKLGSRGDSYYEYLAKLYLQTNQTEQIYRTKFEEAIDGIMRHLVGYSKPNGLLFVGERPQGRQGKLEPKMDHLVCFLPGTIALFVNQVKAENSAQQSKYNKYMVFAEKLLETCYQMYNQMPLHLSAEIAYFNLDDKVDQDIIVHEQDAFNILRPETVESLFYFWRITKKQKYRDQAWQIFTAIEKYSRIPERNGHSGGYSSLRDVHKDTPRREDKMESFFLSETLKYLYLTFSDDDSILPLDKYVFNTEAHPLPIADFKSSSQYLQLREILKAHTMGFF
ncbi:hypothetical protein MIR68_009497 [Amoeboaphelidium protococcarum]|nr:hypothetical protein MIR68_009497 [Amoeboaphelidium protococcarum]